MQHAQAISILETLAGGSHPAGISLPPDVVDALSTALSALRDPPAARPRPVSAGSRWTDEEDAALCREFDEGIAIAELARQHNRTRGAITARLVKLERLDPSAVRSRQRGANLQ